MLYLDRHGFVSPPYVWADMTNSEVRERFSKVDIYNDADLNLHYTLLEGKRIYSPVIGMLIILGNSILIFKKLNNTPSQLIDI